MRQTIIVGLIMLAALILITAYDANGFSLPLSLILSQPTLQSVHGGPLCNISTGQQLVITTNVQNHSDKDLEFVAFLEVRDLDGATEYLSWQSGLLEPDGQTQLAVAWTPDNAGQYELRTFTISKFDEPQVLSAVASSQIDIASPDDPGSC